MGLTKPIFLHPSVPPSFTFLISNSWTHAPVPPHSSFFSFTFTVCSASNRSFLPTQVRS
ncbi:hypothetical protein Lser_V15G31474 [Lactuca serriola]